MTKIIFAILLIVIQVQGGRWDICKLCDCNERTKEIICEKTSSIFMLEIPAVYKTLRFHNSMMEDFKIQSGQGIERVFVRGGRLAIKHFDLSDFKKLTELHFLQVKLKVSTIKLASQDVHVLVIDGCNLTVADKPMLIDTFKLLPNLFFLSLTGNKFEELSEDMFEPLKKLQILELDNNKLKKIPSFLSFQALENFDITDNFLTSFPDDLLANTANKVRNFEIGKNNFNTIFFDFSPFKSLNLVELGEMSLSCNCKWLSSLNVSVIQPTNQKCHKLVDGVMESTNITYSDFAKSCSETYNEADDDKKTGDGGWMVSNTDLSHTNDGTDSPRTIYVVLAFILAILVIALVAFIANKLWQSHKRSSQAKQQVKYSAVYKETTEAHPASAKA